MRLVIPPGVFRPRSDTWMLAAALHREQRIPGARALDLCSGSGALAVAAGKAGARSVTAADVSRRAVAATRINGLLNGVRVRTVRGDLFAPLAGRSYDVIVSNPPYLPAPDDEPPRSGPQRAWDGGSDGRSLIDRIARQAAEHLRPGGILLLVQSSICGVDRTLELLAGSRLDAEVVERRRGRLGPLLAARARDLERRGLLAEGEREEDLVVLRARMPAGGVRRLAGRQEVAADASEPVG
jgi:release factor glutamine methyltransferase